MLIFSVGFFHWFLQRSTAILLFLLLVLIFLFDSIFLNFIFFICLAIHLKLGVENLINDYCHDKVLKIFSMLQLRLFFIYILKFLIFSI